MSQKLIKLIIIGDSDANKTGLLVSYCDEEQVERRSQLKTIGIDFKIKHIVINKTNLNEDARRKHQGQSNINITRVSNGFNKVTP